MISVILPAYNAARFIEVAVESILAQSRRAEEFIVVDDGSSDGTRECLEAYAQRGQLRLIRSEHIGGSAALNLAASHATGDWLAVMHADDEALPQRLARQAEAAAACPEAVVWGAHAYHINEAGRVLGLSRFGPESVEEFERAFAAGEEVMVLHPTAMLKRSVFEAVGGYDSRFNNAEDLDLMMRMARHGPVLTLPEPLLRYRHHGSSNTMRDFRNQHRVVQYLVMSRQRELAGLPAIAWEDYEAHLAQRTPWRKLFNEAELAAYYHYRKAATLIGQGRRVRGLGNLALSLALRPTYGGAKLWRQVASPEARRLRRNADSS